MLLSSFIIYFSDITVVLLHHFYFITAERQSHGKPNALNSLANDKFLDWSKLKVFADDKSNVAEKLKFV